MAYLFSKLAAGAFALWGLFVVSGANVGFYNPAPLPAPSPANTVYEGLERPTEALQANVELPATTTTITTIANCDDVINLARQLGWPDHELGTLRKIANAESACQPWAHNVKDPNGGSYGLLQINGFWCLPNSNYPLGWLQQLGIVSTCDDLYSATANLQAGLAILSETGWHAWTTFNG
jgi:hypothetical protein